MKYLLIAATVLCYALSHGNIVCSVQSGNWNTNSTWSSGNIPTNLDSVIVNPGHEITMNKDSAQIFFMEVFGSLKWTTVKSSTTKYLHLHSNSLLFSSFFIGSLTIDSLLSINDGICSIANLHLNSKNLCDVKGELLFTSESGTKQFKNINIHSGGKWNNDSNDDPVIEGNIINNGIFKACATSGCTYHFTQNATLSGDSLISLPRVESSSSIINKGILEITHSLNGNPDLINEGKLQLQLSPLTFHVNQFSTSTIGNTVVYNDTSEQNIFLPSNGYYENIILQNGNKIIKNDLLVGTSLRVETNCILKSDTFKISAAGTATLQLDSLAALWIGSNDNKISKGFPKNFSSVSLHKNSTVRYQAMGDENIESSVLYGNLNIDDGSVTQSIKSISNDNLNVAGNLTLEESSVLLQCNHCALQVDGNWEGIGNLKMGAGTFYFKGNGNNNGVFYPGKSIVIYNGNDDQIMKVGNYYQLNINKNSGKTILKGNDHILEIEKNLRLQKGTFEMGNESVLINDSIIVEDVLSFTSTKQSKTFKNFIITVSGKVNMKSEATININGNWNNAGTFSAGKSEVVFSDSTKNQSLTGVTTFYDLGFKKKNTSVILNSSIKVNHWLNIYSGKINISDYTIQMASSAKIVGENYTNYIFGDHGKIQITKNIIAGIPDTTGALGIIFDPLTSLGATTVSRSHKSISINGLSSISRVYEIVPDINNNLDVNVIFSFFPNELNNQQKSKLELWKSEDGIFNWQKINGTLDTLNNSISVNNISSFSIWSFLEKSADPLPVTWLNFNLLTKENAITLVWETATEKNTDQFIVQQSEDAVNFTDINSINACGNCYHINQYMYTLQKPDRITYFRIKSIDADNFIDYSAIRAFEPAKHFNIQTIYFDCTGKELSEINTKEDLPNGIYFYKRSNNERGKIIIQK